MLDIKFVRANPDVVKDNIRKKFQDEKLVLVDEVIELDKKYREGNQRLEFLRSRRNALSKQIGGMMARKEFDLAAETKKEVSSMGEEMTALKRREQNWK